MATTGTSWPYPEAHYSKERVCQLATPKRLPAAFVADRRSVYWVDKQPLTGPTKFALTPRQEELVQSKHYHRAFIPDRPTPKWEVPTAALLAKPSQRIKRLALAKPYHPAWIPMRPVYTELPKAALRASASSRLDELSQPKTYLPLPIKSNSDWDWGEWVSIIPKEVKNHVASTRLEQLAEPRTPSEGYTGNRSVMWIVPKTAMQTQATTRLQQLARPKTRQALDQDYDPYRVSFAARIAVPSPRVEDLAIPIPRKVRSKKTG